ncbi:MAG: phage/plasmid primase, P4 family, partial [Verrucomicrobiota bacterium JB024]|nr:phage/plasmid primase, P4 family [Verrucomicrobiota bacterium JB024]
IAEIFSNYPDAEEAIRHLYELMGYMIQPTREHAAWVLFHGKGANGKSLVAGALQALVGPTGSTSRSLGTMGDQSRNNHAEAGLVGKLMLVDDDFRKGAMLPDDQLKRLSEAKLITANPKGSAEFNFVCRTTPMILSNHWPRTSDSSYGLERRGHIFHFNRVFSEQEKDVTLLRRIIETELPGLLNHCIAGWRRLMSRGHFIEPQSCRKYKDVWLANRNVPSSFISEHVTMDKTHRESGMRLWEAFTAWSQEANAGFKMGRYTFYESIDELPNVAKIKVDNVTYFTGIRLVDVEKLGLLADLLDEDDTMDDLI